MNSRNIVAVTAGCLLLVLTAGCGKDEPKTVNVDFTINGKKVDLDAVEKRSTDEEGASKKLAAWKAKWFDTEGKFSKGDINISGARLELMNVTANHSKTKAAKEAESLSEMLSQARAAKTTPTLPK